MNNNNIKKNRNIIDIQGVREFKPSILNNLKSGFVGFDSLISTGRNLYVGDSHKTALNHALTNFSSSIRQEYQSECKDFNNIAICFNEEQLKSLMVCLAAAGINNHIYIHDLTSNKILKDNSHPVSIMTNANFLTDLLIEDTDFEYPDKNQSSLNQIIGSLVTSRASLPSSFTDIANGVDFTFLSKRLSSSLPECYVYTDLIKPGVVNIFLCEPVTHNDLGNSTPLLIAKAFSRGALKNKIKSRLFISDIALINDTDHFLKNVLAVSGVDNSIFREIYAVSSQCLSGFYEEPLCDNEIEHHIVSDLGVDVLYSHKTDDNGINKFESFYTLGDEKHSQTSLVSRCVYDIVTDNIKFQVK